MLAGHRGGALQSPPARPYAQGDRPLTGPHTSLETLRRPHAFPIQTRPLAMNIGFLLPASFAVGNPFNGIREQAAAQADALATLGHEVVRLDPWERIDANDLDILQFFVGGPAMHGLEQRITALRCKVVFAPIIDSTTGNRSYRLAATAGRLHPRLFTTPGTFARQAAFSDAIVVRSNFERERLIEGLGADAARVHLVLNGCNPGRTADPEIARADLDLPEDFVLHVSRFTNRSKNVERMIEAIGPTGLPLIVAGTSAPGAVKDRIDATASRYPNVRFVGRVNDEIRDSLYAACRVFCLPSTREGTGLVALEAAAQGAAVVITANGGPPDYFGDLAHYVHRGEAEEIRDAVQRAWASGAHPNLRDHVRQRLSWQRSAESLVDVYRSLR